MSAELRTRSLADSPFVVRDRVVVICGPSRAGNRRARRLVVQAAGAGFDVVWIDAFDERGGAHALLQLDGGADVTGSIEWLSADDELDARLRAGLLWRVADRCTGWRGARWVRDRGALRGALGSLSSNLRRVARLRRGIVLWRCVDAQLDAGSGDPAAIVHTDDFAVTTAWHLARRYPEVPAANELPPQLLDRQGPA